MSKHTPGPWYYHEDGVGPAISRDAFPGYRVIYGPRGSGRWKNSPELPLEITRGRKIEDEEVEANWRLMTAAPELLTALKGILELTHELGIQDHPKYSVRAVRQAIEAIEKAEGQK